MHCLRHMESMISIQNTEARYGAVAILLHWLMAILLLGLLIMGFYMVSLPDVGFDSTKLNLIFYHKAVGIGVLILLALRLAWRIINVVPDLASTLPEWQQISARVVHLTFYAVITALPLTGWIMSSAAAVPVKLGHYTLPDVVFPNESLYRQMIALHSTFGYLLSVLIVIHAAAALRHHFGLKDGALRKILPQLSAGKDNLTPRR